jgi:threonine dehydrogenase-like Zn-dependent dehydrogenase
MEMSPVRSKFARERMNLRVISSKEDLGGRPRAIFDCTGNPKSMIATFEMLAHGGQIIFVGLFLGDIVFYNPNFHAREITLKSSRNATAADFKRVISYLEQGIVDVRLWFNGVTAPGDVAASYARWLDPEEGIIKPMINWEG